MSFLFILYTCNLEPPQRDDTLPDLRRLMDSLEDGQTDLEAKDDPPALFTGPTHIPSYTKISGKKRKSFPD